MSRTLTRSINSCIIFKIIFKIIFIIYYYYYYYYYYYCVVVVFFFLYQRLLQILNDKNLASLHIRIKSQIERKEGQL